MKDPKISVVKKNPGIPDGEPGSELMILTVQVEIRGRMAWASDVFSLHDVVTGHTWADLFESIGKVFRRMEENR